MLLHFTKRISPFSLIIEKGIKMNNVNNIMISKLLSDVSTKLKSTIDDILKNQKRSLVSSSNLDKLKSDLTDTIKSYYSDIDFDPKFDIIYDENNRSAHLLFKDIKTALSMMGYDLNLYKYESNHNYIELQDIWLFKDTDGYIRGLNKETHYINKSDNDRGFEIFEKDVVKKSFKYKIGDTVVFQCYRLISKHGVVSKGVIESRSITESSDGYNISYRIKSSIGCFDQYEDNIICLDKNYSGEYTDTVSDEINN